MKKIVLLAALGLAMIGASAEAAVFTVTYTGKVTFGGDDTNYFGLGQQLGSFTPNRGVTIRFTIDSERPGSTSSDNSETATLEGFGEASNPFIQSSFTLNGRTVAWSNSPVDGYDSSYAYAQHDDSPDFDETFHSSYDYAQNENSYDTAAATVFSNVNDIIGTTDLAAPLEYDVRSGDTGFGSFGSARYDQASGQYTRLIGLNFEVNHVSIAAVSAVPEPTSWAMLIAGFGASGLALRRKRAFAAGLRSSL